MMPLVPLPSVPTATQHPSFSNASIMLQWLFILRSIPQPLSDWMEIAEHHDFSGQM